VAIQQKRAKAFVVITCSDTLAVVLMQRTQVWIYFTFLDHISLSILISSEKNEINKTVYIVLWTHDLLKKTKKNRKASIISVKLSFFGKSE